MNVHYKVYSWDFNRALWAQTMKQWTTDFSIKEVAELLGVSTGAVSGWMSMESGRSHPWPSMMCFMKAVNELDLNPSDFFVIEE